MKEIKTDRSGKVAILLSGRGSNFISILENSRREDSLYSVSLVVSDNKTAPGIIRARQEKLPTLTLSPADYPNRPAYETEVCRHLRAHRIDLICLAGYMRLVGKTLLNAYPGRILNIHPSLLPSFPGLNAQRQALDWGAKLSGCTVHFVDSGLDRGPIIMQQAVPVLCSDDEESLSSRILVEEHRIYPLAISLFFSGRLTKEGRRVTIK